MSKIARCTFLPLPAEPTRELVLELGDDWDGAWEFDPEVVRGARVKPVVYVPEGRLALLDRDALRKAIVEAGATYCRTPTIHVSRLREKRDARHDAELPLEESLRIFGEETRARDLAEKVAFAAELAREADAGVTE